LTNGCSSAISVMIQTLCNSGDSVLLPAPYYGGFSFDVTNVAEAKIIPVVSRFSESTNFIPTAEKIRTAYFQAIANGESVKVLLLCNPYNPTGAIITRSNLLEILKFAATEKIHVIVDEIYGLSTWDQALSEDEKWESVYSIEQLPDPERTHICWSFSKDFRFDLSGARCGTIISRNPDFIKAAMTFAHTTTICNFLDEALTNVLQDRAWIDSFIHDNALYLADNYFKLTSILSEHGINFIKASGGFFAWVDFSPFLKGARHFCSIKNITASSDEEALFLLFLQAGTYIARGAAFYSEEPGWFRILFASNWDVVSLAMERVLGVISLLSKEI
ncbi:hypothetical protein HK096_000179, partial [Nowakowskiella sp. JEL0078]